VRELLRAAVDGTFALLAFLFRFFLVAAPRPGAAFQEENTPAFPESRCVIF
jgi:hypothetical protein